MGQEEKSDLKKSNLDIPAEIVDEWWTNLTLENHSESSPKEDTYNCIAWAAGKNNDRWAPYKGYFWPKSFPKKDIPDGDDLQNHLDVFHSLGYAECNDGECEVGFEKIVIYVKNRSVEHMARQKSNGRWTSKLGELYHDIEHLTLEAVDSPFYGDKKIFMRKPFKNT